MASLFKFRSLLALVVAAALTVLSMLAASLLYLNQTRQRDAVIDIVDRQLQLSRVFSLLQDAETGQRGYLLAGRDDYLAPFNRAEESLPHAFDALATEFAHNPSLTNDLAALRRLGNAKLDEMRRTIAVKRAGRDADARQAVLSGPGKALMDQVRDLVEHMRATERSALRDANVRLQRAEFWTEAGILLALLLSLVLGAIVVVDSQRQYRVLSTANNELLKTHNSLLAEIARREQAEDHLRQSQKMEAIGQLTGGLAHDFNNMLAVIIGSLNLLKRRLARGETAVDQFIDSAVDGAERAATLTHRLLAFARQQPLAPAPVDANKLVGGISEVIRRTLGDDIRVETVLAGGLWRTHADPAQLESAILNLAVNARDAMPEGGRLTIETANASLDDDYASRHADVPAGQYVMIAVTDSGHGMSPDIVAKAFDPYFTTKGVGKGTGLGLSQVAGFVKQSKGHVKIYSEVGHGTTVKIYLPRFAGPLEEPTVAKPAARETAPDSFNGALALVVEDETRMRNFAVEAFRELGFEVLSAEDAVSALRLVDAHPDLALLFTDIVMPDKNGRALADEACRRNPELKVVYTTGFSRNAVIHNGVLDDGVHFLAKPFTFDQLAAKLRAVLG